MRYEVKSSVKFARHNEAQREANKIAKNYQKIETRKGEWKGKTIKSEGFVGWYAVAEFWENI